MKLIDVVRKLDRINDGKVIYIDDFTRATPQSTVALLEPSETGGALPRDGMHYFLEVTTARDCVEAWAVHRKRKKATLADKCAAIIYYAQNDAYLPPPGAATYKGPPLQLVEPGRRERVLGPVKMRVASKSRKATVRKRR